jgi:hypothetical protein
MNNEYGRWAHLMDAAPAQAHKRAHLGLSVIVYFMHPDFQVLMKNAMESGIKKTHPLVRSGFSNHHKVMLNFLVLTKIKR